MSQEIIIDGFPVVPPETQVLEPRDLGALSQEDTTFFRRIDVRAFGVRANLLSDLVRRADAHFSHLARNIGRATGIKTVVLDHDWALIHDPNVVIPRWRPEVMATTLMPTDHSLIASVKRIELAPRELPAKKQDMITRACIHQPGPLERFLAPELHLRDTYHLADNGKKQMSLGRYYGEPENTEPYIIIHDLDIMFKRSLFSTSVRFS